MGRLEVAAAETLLGCRRGATRVEVQAAYRRTLHRERPDLGAVDGARLRDVQAARDLLLACAPPDRRRRARREAGSAAPYLSMRRSVWGLVDERQSRLELRL
jgi:hypothetical protein